MPLCISNLILGQLLDVIGGSFGFRYPRELRHASGPSPPLPVWWDGQALDAGRRHAHMPSGRCHSWRRAKTCFLICVYHEGSLSTIRRARIVAEAVTPPPLLITPRDVGGYLCDHCWYLYHTCTARTPLFLLHSWDNWSTSTCKVPCGLSHLLTNLYTFTFVLAYVFGAIHYFFSIFTWFTYHCHMVLG